MIYLIIAILFGSLFAILFKIFAKKGINTLQAIIINYATALLIGPIANISQWHITSSSFTQVPIIPATLTGLFMMGGFIAMSSSTKSHGVAVTTIATRVSFIIPTICAYLFLGEATLEPLTSIMVILALLLIFYSKGRDGIELKRWYNPVLVFICYGVANYLLKYSQSQVTGNGALLALTTVTFTSALILSTIFYRISGGKFDRFQWRNIIAGLILGCANIGCTYFLLKALTQISTATLYPIYNISIVAIGVLSGRLLFKEHLTVQQYFGIIIAIIAILIAL